jgi:6-pyruvoyltetrahydropterin/6-carboxytetrahydropterin synthase
MSDYRELRRPLIDIQRQFTYEAAHYLPMVPDEHKCRRLHGHSYHLTVVVRGPIDAELGWVMDFSTLKGIVDALIQQLDHRCLNDILVNPTVENQLVWLWANIPMTRFRDSGVGLYSLQLQETDSSSATYYGGHEGRP